MTSAIGRIGRLEEDDEMVEQIRRFETQVFAVALDGCKRCFHRFLAHLLGAFLDALRQELGGIGDIRRSAAARRHRVGELG
jgi:hypothetical protein